MKNKIIASLVGATLAAGGYAALASSHREAPLIAEDQYVDNTDVYAFISPSDPTKLRSEPQRRPDLPPRAHRPAHRRAHDHHRQGRGRAVERRLAHVPG
jgi:hypothetical protein